MTDSMVTTLVEELRRTRKYRHVCEGILDRTAAWALARHPTHKEASKAAKRKLHQVYGLFFNGLALDRIEQQLAEISNGNAELLRPFCENILRSHVSTAERLPHLDVFYGEVFARIGQVAHILDLGCGLNPFALPWMNLTAGTTYRAIDIDIRLADVTNRFFDSLGLPPMAQAMDIMSTIPEERVDVAFCLKLLPTLEQQDVGYGFRLVEKLNARHIVVSFPRKSVGGRNVGMDGHYSEFMTMIIDSFGTESESFIAGNELVYIMEGRTTS